MISRYENYKGLFRPAPNASFSSRKIQSMSRGGQTFSRGKQIFAQFTSQGTGKPRLATPLHFLPRQARDT